jgi:hypothetical protein
MSGQQFDETQFDETQFGDDDSDDTQIGGDDTQPLIYQKDTQGESGPDELGGPMGHFQKGFNGMTRAAADDLRKLAATLENTKLCDSCLVLENLLKELHNKQSMIAKMQKVQCAVQSMLGKRAHESSVKSVKRARA